jgi:hydroxypyruvate isomerase
MPTFAANLTFLFNEHPFLDRFKAARDAGFRYVEYMFPYEHDPAKLMQTLQDNGLEQALFNLPAGNWAAGDRGIANDPRRVDEFRLGVERAVEYARALGVKRINCLVGKRLDTVPHAVQWQTVVENLRDATKRLAEEDRWLLVEPLNSFDIPGFFLTTSRETLRLFDEVGAPTLKLQYDVYHMQRMEGHLTATIRDNLARIGHIQIADNPGRHQPGTGEINYRFLLPELDRMGYQGYVGLEYVPEPDTLASLGWLKEYRR